MNAPPLLFGGNSPVVQYLRHSMMVWQIYNILDIVRLSNIPDSPFSQSHCTQLSRSRACGTESFPHDHCRTNEPLNSLVKLIMQISIACRLPKNRKLVDSCYGRISERIEDGSNV